MIGAGGFRDQSDGPVLPRRPLKRDDALDITPMIDVTFLLLIFFLVAGVPDVRAALDLPKAQHGTGVSRRESFTISLAEGETPGRSLIYLADGRYGEPLAGTPSAQDVQMRSAVEAARRTGAIEVVIKAERGVKHRDVARVMRAAAVEGVKINLAVAETR